VPARTCAVAHWCIEVARSPREPLGKRASVRSSADATDAPRGRGRSEARPRSRSRRSPPCSARGSAPGRRATRCGRAGGCVGAGRPSAARANLSARERAFGRALGRSTRRSAGGGAKPAPGIGCVGRLLVRRGDQHVAARRQRAVGWRSGWTWWGRPTSGVGGLVSLVARDSTGSFP